MPRGGGARRRLALQERLDRIDLAAHEQPQRARQIEQRVEPAHPQHERGGIDISARGDGGAQRIGVLRHAGTSAAALAFSGSITWVTIGMLAGHTSSHL